MALPVQTYRAPDFTSRPIIAGTTCGALLGNANLAAGSDVIVVRRANTAALADGDTAVSGETYLQANSLSAEIQFGNGAAFTYIAKRTAAGTATTILDKTALRAAPTRKYEVRVYFIAPCSQGSGAGGVCAAGDDTIPTLKRLELKAVGGVRQMAIVPLVEGIEYLKAEWGIDDQPVAVNTNTGMSGDGVVESYIHAGGRIGVLVEVNCETDFVANTDDFRQLARNIAMQVAAMNPQVVSADDPERAGIEGTDEEVCLMSQPFIRDSGRTIASLVQDTIAKTGENVRVRRFVRFELGR